MTLAPKAIPIECWTGVRVHRGILTTQHPSKAPPCSASPSHAPAQGSPCASPAQGAAQVTRISESPPCPSPSACSHLQHHSLLIHPDSHLFLLPPLKAHPGPCPGHQPIEDTLTRTWAKYLHPPAEPLWVLCSPLLLLNHNPPLIRCLEDPPSYEQLSGLTPSGWLLCFSQPGKRSFGGNREKGKTPEKYQHCHSITLQGADCSALALSWAADEDLHFG